jgi:anti-anti-sigma factor
VKVGITENSAMTVAAVTGEIDFETAGALLAALRPAVPNRVQGLVLDLRRTNFFDSAGVGVLYEISRRLGRREQELHVVVEPESLVADLLVEVGFAGHASVHTDLAEAIGELHAHERA